MKNTNVVQLGQVRDLLGEWEKVRQHFLSQKVSGFQISLVAEDGDETVYLGGVYKNDAQMALKATLRVSAARALLEDPPLPLQDFACSRF